jgi:hypothetical protein
MTGLGKCFKKRSSLSQVLFIKPSQVSRIQLVLLLTCTLDAHSSKQIAKRRRDTEGLNEFKPLRTVLNLGDRLKLVIV